MVTIHVGYCTSHYVAHPKHPYTRRDLTLATLCSNEPCEK